MADVGEVATWLTRVTGHWPTRAVKLEELLEAHTKGKLKVLLHDALGIKVGETPKVAAMVKDALDSGDRPGGQRAVEPRPDNHSTFVRAPASAPPAEVKMHSERRNFDDLLNNDNNLSLGGLSKRERAAEDVVEVVQRSPAVVPRLSSKAHCFPEGSCLTCGLVIPKEDCKWKLHQDECQLLGVLYSEVIDQVQEIVSLPPSEKYQVVLVMLHIVWELSTDKSVRGPVLVDKAQVLARCVDVLIGGGLSPSAIPMWVQRTVQREPKITFECNICFNDWEIGETYVMNCAQSHRWCIGCVQNHVLDRIKEGQAPNCPSAGCKHQLEESEVKQLFQKDWLRFLEDKKQLELAPTIAARWDRILFERLMSQMPNAARCPIVNLNDPKKYPRMTRDCQYICELRDPDGLSRERVVCPVCSPEYAFCNLCRLPYHFRTTCDQARRLAQEWNLWCARDRAEYHKLKEDNAAFEVAKERLKVRHQEQEARNREDADVEEWKRQNAKLCPNCRRVVWRETGCDNMVCGRTMAGNTTAQNGCFQSFNWASAPAYVPTYNRMELDKLPPAPKEACTTKHPMWTCDGCQKDIVGIRFECIHCSSFNLCENCEYQVDHEVDHIFRLRRDEENVEEEAATLARLDEEERQKARHLSKNK